MEQPQEDINVNDRLLKVSSSTDSNKLAGSIISAYNGGTNVKVTLRAIGAGALNQATKAIIICKGELAKKGVKPLVNFSFKDLDDFRTAGAKITALEMTLELYKL
jgi:stage V sporulation protein SpoVS